MQTIEEYQTAIDAEAYAGKCFYCHLTVYDWDVEALHLANARGVTQHIHGDCDKELRAELAFDNWVAEQAERVLTAPSGLLEEVVR